MYISQNWKKWLIRGFAALFIIVPLMFTPWNYELFEYNKMMMTYILTALIFGVFLLSQLTGKRIVIRRTPWDVPIFIFVLTQLVSTIFSIDPHVSWWGYYSRFNGGMFSVITYVLLFYIFVSSFSRSESPSAKDPSQDSEKPLIRLLKSALMVGLVVAFYGFLERLGVDKHLWVQDVQSRVFSSLGQPNWLAAYLISLSPIALAFACIPYLNRTKGTDPQTGKSILPIPSIFWTAAGIFLFLVTLFTRSRTGIGAYYLTTLIFGSILFLIAKRPVKMLLSIVAGSILLISMINGTYISQLDSIITFSSISKRLNHKPPAPVSDQPTQQPAGPLLEVGGTESGIIRKYVWQGALTAWRSSAKTFLIGTGTETFAWAFFQYRPKEHNLVSEWDFLYNKAHNEYLNFLATTGILGLGSYLILLATIAFWYLKTIYRLVRISLNRKSPDGDNPNLSPATMLTLQSALFTGWLSILITNFFGFSVVIMQIFLFLLPAVSYALTTTADRARYLTLPVKPGLRKWSVIATSVGMALVTVALILHWIGDVQYASGYRKNRSGLPLQAQGYLAKAIALNGSEPLYRDEMANSYANIATLAIERNDASSAAQLLETALSQNGLALETSPKNVNFWKTRTKIYYTAALLDPTHYDPAIASLTTAATLSPNDPKIFYNLGILYGRKAEIEKAIENVRTSIDLKPNYKEAYYGLYTIYTETGKTAEAKSAIQTYLDKVNPNDQEFRTILEDELR